MKKRGNSHSGSEYSRRSVARSFCNSVPAHPPPVVAEERGLEANRDA